MLLLIQQHLKYHTWWQIVKVWLTHKRLAWFDDFIQKPCKYRVGGKSTQTRQHHNIKHMQHNVHICNQYYILQSQKGVCCHSQYNLFISIVSLLNIVLTYYIYIFECILFLVLSTAFECSNSNVGEVALYENTVPPPNSQGIVVVCVEVAEGEYEKAAICYDGNSTFNIGAAAAACRQKSHSTVTSYNSGSQ